MSLTLSRGNNRLELEYKTDFVAWTKQAVEQVGLDAELVFVGYGTIAPEYEWNDFKNIDISDKVLLFLVNDPPGEDIFGGKAMTYYGRWTYKYEIAAELGAAGAFIVHETGPAGYPWEVVTGSWTGEQFDLVTPDKNMDRVAVEGWLSLDQTRALFDLAGLDFDEQKRAAGERSFQPVPMEVTAKIDINSTLRSLDSTNVAAKIVGGEAADEWIVYCAHWDHFGIDPSLSGDNIFNGALDNATGTAGLLEIAKGFMALDEPPRRSVLFLAVTAEEFGLLGSRYYAENPLYPPEKTVAAINMDALNIWGRTRDLPVIGMGQSSLDDLAREVAEEQNRVLLAEPEPEKGFYYRSDHFSFAKAGIPAFYPDSGVDFIGRPEGWGMEMREKYTAENYHKPSDEVGEEWNLEGAVEDLELLFEMGSRLANGSDWPEWSTTSEFRAKREEQMKK